MLATPVRRSTAAFDERRVIGPGVNLHLDRNHRWTGFLQGHAVSLDATEGHLDDASLSLAFTRSDDGGIEIRGHWSTQQRTEPIYVRVSARDFFARGATGTPSLLLPARGVGRYVGQLNGDYEVELRGGASLPDPPEPQFALAILGALGG